MGCRFISPKAGIRAVPQHAIRRTSPLQLPPHTPLIRKRYTMPAKPCITLTSKVFCHQTLGFEVSEPACLGRAGGACMASGFVRTLSKFDAGLCGFALFTLPGKAKARIRALAKIASCVMLRTPSALLAEHFQTNPKPPQARQALSPPSSWRQT